MNSRLETVGAASGELSYGTVGGTAPHRRAKWRARGYEYEYPVLLQDLEEQKRTKYKINGTATTVPGTSTHTKRTVRFTQCNNQ